MLFRSAANDGSSVERRSKATSTASTDGSLSRSNSYAVRAQMEIMQRDFPAELMQRPSNFLIAERDLQAFAGVVTDEPTSSPYAHVSTVVHIDSVDRSTMGRLTTHLTAAAISDSRRPRQLDVHSTYDESASRLTVFVVGDPESTSAVVGLIGALIRQDDK